MTDWMKRLAARSTWWHKLPPRVTRVNAAGGRGQPWTYYAGELHQGLAAAGREPGSPAASRTTSDAQRSETSSWLASPAPPPWQWSTTGQKQSTDGTRSSTIPCEPPPGLLATLLDLVGGWWVFGRPWAPWNALHCPGSFPDAVIVQGREGGSALPDAGLRGRQLTALRSRSPAANRVPWRLVCCHSSLPSEGRSPLASGVRA